MHEFAPLSENHSVHQRTVTSVSIRAVTPDGFSVKSLLRDGLLIQPQEIVSATVRETTITEIRRVRLPDVA